MASPSSGRSKSKAGVIHGFLSAKHPLLGTFAHAPSANNAGSKYFQEHLVSVSEHQRLKDLRHNPFTGQFHCGPQMYTKLHNLKRFRNSDPNGQWYVIDQPSNPGSTQRRFATKGGATLWATNPTTDASVRRSNSISSVPATGPRLETGSYSDPGNDASTIGSECSSDSRSFGRASVSTTGLMWDDSLPSTASTMDVDGGMSAGSMSVPRPPVVRSDSIIGRSLRMTNVADPGSPLSSSHVFSVEEGDNARSAPQRGGANLAQLHGRTPSVNDTASPALHGTHGTASPTLNGVSASTPHGSISASNDTPTSVRLPFSSSPRQTSPTLNHISSRNNKGRPDSQRTGDLSLGETSQLSSKTGHAHLTPDKLRAIQKTHKTPRFKYKRTSTSSLPLPTGLASDAVVAYKDWGGDHRVSFDASKSSTFERESRDRAHTVDADVVMGIQTFQSGDHASDTSRRHSLLGKIATWRNRAVEKRNKTPVVVTQDQNPWAVNRMTDVFEKYQVLEGHNANLGGGTYSKVKSVVSKATGIFYALKVVQKKYLLSEEEKAMVKREVEIHQVLRHENIIRLCEVFEDNAHLYLVLEKANYGTLESLVINRPLLSESDACIIMAQLLQAIRYLHENGVLQADIKPSNILLNCAKVPRKASFQGFNPTDGSSFRVAVSDLQVKLCDFGLSRKVPDVKYYKHTGDVHKVPYTTTRGTIGYIAPEILRESSYGVSADMWSAGIIMYELVGSMKPFLPYTDCLSTPVTFPEVVWKTKSTIGRDLIRRLLQIDASARISAKEALEHGWIQLYAFSSTRS